MHCTSFCGSCGSANMEKLALKDRLLTVLLECFGKLPFSAFIAVVAANWAISPRPTSISTFKTPSVPWALKPCHCPTQSPSDYLSPHGFPKTRLMCQRQFPSGPQSSPQCREPFTLPWLVKKSFVLRSLSFNPVSACSLACCLPSRMFPVSWG